MSNYSHMYNWVLGPSRVPAQLGLKAMGLASGKMHYKSNILSSKYPTVLQQELGVHKWGYLNCTIQTIFVHAVVW